MTGLDRLTVRTVGHRIDVSCPFCGAESHIVVEDGFLAHALREPSYCTSYHRAGHFEDEGGELRLVQDYPESVKYRRSQGHLDRVAAVSGKGAL